MLDNPICDYPANKDEAKKRERRYAAPLEDLEKYISHYLHGADVLALWLDNDRAGENI